jgi:diaminopimelate epimerase
MSALPFVKMHGLGNDFVVLDRFAHGPALGSWLTADRARWLADRHFGVGCDQLLVLGPPRDAAAADARMDIWNADGSVADMCGNGIRAAALYLNRRPPLQGRARLRFETLAGVKTTEVAGDRVRVDMEPPKKLGNAGGELLRAAGREFRFLEVDVGNPHAVIFVDDVAAVPLAEWGPVLETHARFPRKANIEFVQVEARNRIRVRVWERGAGITLACGTGACAAAVAAVATQRTDATLEVHLPGGMLEISWAGPGQSVFMTGPATESFSGELRI